MPQIFDFNTVKESPSSDSLTIKENEQNINKPDEKDKKNSKGLNFLDGSVAEAVVEVVSDAAAEVGSVVEAVTGTVADLVSGKSINDARETLLKMKISEQEQELASLRSELKSMELVLQQYSTLEKEVTRLCTQLEEATSGISYKGYLYKWREKEIFYASKWGMRYFTLQGNKLCYYGSEYENRPRRTIMLKNCFVKDEGSKKGGLYHVFSIYFKETDGMDEGFVIRLSSQRASDARTWIEMLRRACEMSEEEGGEAEKGSGPLENSLPEMSETFKETIRNSERNSSSSFTLEKEPSKSNLSLSLAQVSQKMLKRVQSSSLMLQRSLSKNNLLAPPPASTTTNLNHNEESSTVPSASTIKHRKSQTVSGTELNKLVDVPPETSSTISNSEVKKKPRMIKKFPAYKPMHVRSIPSPLSEGTPSGEYSYRGFFNLCIIIFAITHIDLLVYNLHTNGIKFTFLNILRPTEVIIPDIDSNKSLFKHVCLSVSIWFISIFSVFFFEKFLSKRSVNEKYVLFVNWIIGLFNIIAPCYMVWTSCAHPSLNLIYLFQSVIIWMKLISYSHCNKDLRLQYYMIKKHDKDLNSPTSRPGYKKQLSESEIANASFLKKQISEPSLNAMNYQYFVDNSNDNQFLAMITEIRDLQLPLVLYPNNLTFSNLLYFLLAPTLCYQLNYPRTDRINWKKVSFILFRLVLIAFAIVFAVEQYIQPTLESSFAPMSTLDPLGVLENLLKLAIPSTYVWLLGFYFYFHLWLNLLAELLRFGDRLFYKDWWNAKTIDSYWRTWNIPVHNWCIRHLYYPVLRTGYSKNTAGFVVFLFSAFMHELVISFPFQYISFHAFNGMLAQFPLIFIFKYLDMIFDNHFLGNALFWCTFCMVGQPMGVLLYYYDLTKMAQGAA